MTGRPTEPKLDRSFTLHLRGDWGSANLHRVCGWVTQELAGRSGPDTRIAIWNSRGFADAVRAVGDHEVDIAMATPAAFTTAALDGRGVYAGQEFPHLRALGVVPQRDRLVLAVHRDLNVTTIAELRQRTPELRLATSVRDGVNHVGIGAHALLERSGIDVTGWGGRFLEDERPFESLGHVLAGRANAIIHEAVMLPEWQRFAPDYRFLSVEQDVLAGLEADYSWPSATVEDGFFAGAGGFRTLDFSDFVMLTTTELDEDIAYAVAWVLGETREVIEKQYRHLPAARSPITYPLDPVTMGKTPVPLHPGAARYYEALPTTT
ncbi:hypothetical protein [Catenulispora pinisilvae]|uniref:hypothetical protein n=1 Tax=Catenulispora pinisilvae TaxID=2705253 RepID=UPI0018921510|nr:hypothetical protein [Catenulispora pinisilvae]